MKQPPTKFKLVTKDELPRLIRQGELRSAYNLHWTYIRQMEINGLRPIKIGKRLTMYDLKNFEEVLERMSV